MRLVRRPTSPGFTAALFILLALLPCLAASADPYSILQISPVPGLALPFGNTDALIAVGPIGNISGRIDLLQAAGVFNIAKRLQGVQAAGVFNISDGGLQGLQAAGIFNIAGGRESHVQAAGIFNIAGDVQGAQASGIFNIADEVDGAQVASLFNIAKEVRGFQVGMVNVAGKVRGIQVGLVNIASNGIMDVSVTLEPEIDHAGARFKTGNTSFFAVYGLRMPRGEVWTDARNIVLSAGAGTRLGNARSLYMDISVSASQAMAPDPVRFIDAMQYRNGLKPADVLAMWPSADMELGLNLGALRVVAGLQADLWLASAPNMPAALAKGMGYSNTWLGESFALWSKWRFGVEL